MDQALIDQIDARSQVGLIVVAADKVREPFRRVGSDVVHVVDWTVVPQLLYKIRTPKITLSPTRSRQNVFTGTTGKIIGPDHIEAQSQAMLRDVGSDKSGSASNKDPFSRHYYCRTSPYSAALDGPLLRDRSTV